MNALEISLAAIAVSALFTTLGFIVRELGAVRATLAAIHEQVLPEGAPSLSSTVATHTVQLAVLESHFRPVARSTR